jgi:hypothetical protein
VAEIVTAVDSMGITGAWQIFRDADGRQIGRVKIEPGAATRKGAGAAGPTGSGLATAPAHDFNRERDDAQLEMPIPQAAKERREMEERFGFRERARG